jgi:hypothetical protein
MMKLTVLLCLLVAAVNAFVVPAPVAMRTTRSVSMTMSAAEPFSVRAPQLQGSCCSIMLCNCAVAAGKVAALVQPLTLQFSSTKSFWLLVASMHARSESVAPVVSRFNMQYLQRFANSILQHSSSLQILSVFVRYSFPQAFMTIAAAATDDAAKVAADAAADIENYGAVAAPGWVLPLGALAVIATALLPIYLKSGGDASKQMQDRGTTSLHYQQSCAIICCSVI